MASDGSGKIEQRNINEMMIDVINLYNAELATLDRDGAKQNTRARAGGEISFPFRSQPSFYPGVPIENYPEADREKTVRDNPKEFPTNNP